MKTKHQQRTTAFDEAIGKLQSELAELAQQRREMVRDLNSDSEKLAKLGAQMQGLREKVEVQRELRAEAAKLDARDSLIRERESMRVLQNEMMQVLASREADAQELDLLCAQIGTVLQRIAAKNEAAWPMFRAVSKYITQGDVRPARFDSLMFANQPRISTASAMSSALVIALRNAGLGRVGILENQALDGIVGYRVEHPVSIEEAMHNANERVARHLAIVFKQKADELMHDADAA